jgi:hypothetical protein
MLDRSGPARLAFATVFAGAALVFCAGVVLMTAACGIRMSAQDFPVLKLSGPDDNARSRLRPGAPLHTFPPKGREKRQDPNPPLPGPSL